MNSTGKTVWWNWTVKDISKLPRMPRNLLSWRTQLFNIQVLGTRFNVFAYAGKESKFETCLVEGRVLVYNKNNKNEKVYLNPHEKSIVSKQPHGSVYFQLRQWRIPEEWYFQLSLKAFRRILSYLALWYNVQFNFTGDVKLDERISGKIRQSEDVDNILIALQGVYPFKFKKNRWWTLWDLLNTHV